MVIAKDQTGLPKNRGGGRSWQDPARKAAPPNAPPALNTAVKEAVEAWFTAWQAREGFHRPMSVADRQWRGSWSGTRCDRAAWYRVTGEPESDPPGVSAYWRMAAGQMAHELLDKHLGEALAKAVAKMFALPVDQVVAEFEVPVDLLGPLGVSGASTADWVVYHYEDIEDIGHNRDVGIPLLAVEVKTKGGYKFKLAATTFNGPPEGADAGDVIQGALAAAALGTPLWVLDLSLENLSQSVAAKHGYSDEQLFSAGWWFPAEDAAGIAAVEVERIQRILAEPMVPLPMISGDPEVHPQARVTPGVGTWVANLDDGTQVAGTTWRCGYCSWRQTCVKDG